MKIESLILKNITSPQGFEPFPEAALDGTYVDRLEAMVARYPEHVAVSDRGRKVTYGALNAAANQLAWAILALEAAPGGRVAFMAVQDLESVVAILGILKAGKTYVPINTSFPAGRVRDLAVELGVTSLVTTSSTAPETLALLAGQTGLQIIDGGRVAGGRSDNPGLEIATSLPPYLGYTSGSTGKPKTIIHHTRGLLDQQRVKTNELGLLASDRWAVLNPLSFGGGSFSLFGALMNGATACLYDLASHGLAGIPDWMVAEGITVVNTPPPVFRKLFGDLPAGAKFPAVRLIILSGDTMMGRDVSVTREHFKADVILANMLALTEVGIVSRAFIDLSQVGEAVLEGTVPVGYPFDGVTLTVFNEEGHPVAQGQEGEIVVTSRYITLDPSPEAHLLESGKVRVDKESGLRTVRSGDLGRLRADGTLEYLGRMDSVVKLRGLRVEVGEVEAILHQHAQVREAAVLALASPVLAGESTLVAYVALRAGGEKVTVASLRAHLSEALPIYMIPSYFVFVEKIPLNSNGKVERSGLPEPDWKGKQGEGGQSKARNPAEARLVEMWRELLGVDQPGVEQDFFALGGGSLQALQLMARIKADWGLDLPLKTVIGRSTISGLASLIAELATGPARSSITPLRQGGEAPALFVVPGGARTGVSMMKFVQYLAEGRRVYALEYPGMEGYLEAMERIEALAGFFVRQVRSVQEHGPYHLAGLCLGGVIAFEMAQQLKAAGEEVGLLATLDSTPPILKEGRMGGRNPEGGHRSVAALLLAGNFKAVLKRVNGRLRKLKAVRKLRIWWLMTWSEFITPRDQRWLDHRLDPHSARVLKKLTVARKAYEPRPYAGRGLVLLSEQARGTGREEMWAGLFDGIECHYIAGTSHKSIFDDPASLAVLADLLNKKISYLLNK